MTLSHQTIANIINDRLGKKKLVDIVGKYYCNESANTMFKEWTAFMTNEPNCSKHSLTELLKLVGIIIKYGDGSCHDTKVLAKFNGNTADDFIDYVNKNKIKASFYRMDKSSDHFCKMVPHEWAGMRNLFYDVE